MKKLWITLAIITTLTLLVCTGGLVAKASIKPTEPPTVSIPLNADTIFRLVNNERTKAGLQPLVRDARLDASAQTKADDMAANNYLEHVNPTTGKHGYEYMYPSICPRGSENLTMTVPNEIGDFNVNSVKSWMNSKGHRDAMLSKEYGLTGVAVSGSYVTQHFCINN